MIARAHVVAECDSTGATRLTRIRSSPPLVLRQTPQALYLVGGAAGPLGGDDLCLQINLLAGARLTLRTAAASLALPGRTGLSSKLVIRAELSPESSLTWLPEPLIAGMGCRHRCETYLSVHSTAHLRWREELVLGRHNEGTGTVATTTELLVGGTPLLRSELGFGPGAPAPGWEGPAILGGAGAIGSVLLADPSFARSVPPTRCFPLIAAMPLAGPAVYLSGTAPDHLSLRVALEEAASLY
ncbi:MAG: urease accessory protein UreD [Actinomycetota bacterium]